MQNVKQAILIDYDGIDPLPKMCMQHVDFYKIKAREYKRREYLLLRRKEHYKPKGSNADYEDMVECIYIGD